MPRSFKVKICGTTNIRDAKLAAKGGADFFGVVVETDFSPRSLSIDGAESIFQSSPIPGVVLVFNMFFDRVKLVIERLNPFAVQFLGRDNASLLKKVKRAYPVVELWQSVHLPRSGEEFSIDHCIRSVQNCIRAGADSIIFDTASVSEGKMKFGGTGLTSDWNIVQRLIEKMNSPVPIWLAGGITPDNVGKALDIVEPYGIDLCSGVEKSPGKKDPQKVLALMKTINEKSKMRRLQQ